MRQWCGKKASEKLSAARSALHKGDYNEAKLQIDSIKILYPKAFDARRRHQTDATGGTERTAADFSLPGQHDADQAAGTGKNQNKYVLEKDAEYQRVGNYFWPTQTVEKNLHRSFLRFQVNEQGVMSMTSIYCGGNSIHHFAVKVTAPDGSFAETPASKDSYETTDLGEKIEKPIIKWELTEM